VRRLCQDGTTQRFHWVSRAVETILFRTPSTLMTKTSFWPSVLGWNDMKKISCPLADHEGAWLSIRSHGHQNSPRSAGAPHRFRRPASLERSSGTSRLHIFSGAGRDEPDPVRRSGQPGNRARSRTWYRRSANRRAGMSLGYRWLFQRLVSVPSASIANASSPLWCRMCSTAPWLSPTPVLIPTSIRKISPCH